LSDQTEQRQQPNIVFIMTDQQSATALGAAGNPDLHTPAMDRLAAEGTRFERAYCPFPLCVPCRMSMFTGRMPHEIGIYGNGGAIEPEALEQSLGRRLRDAGYTGAYAGKQHLPGFADGSETDWGWQTIAPMDDPRVTQACVDYLAAPPDGPFFLVASYDNPHNICQWARQQPLPRGEVADASTPQCPSLPPNYPVPPYEPDIIRREVAANFMAYPSEAWTDDHWRHYRQAYFRLVEKVDAEIGRVLDAIDQLPDDRPTLTLFLSDHGDGHGAHRLNQKSFLYDEQTRVPLIVRYPGVMPAGRVDATHLVNIGLDVLPTFVDAAGADRRDGHADGHSLLALAHGDPASWRDALYVETNLPEPKNLGTRGRMVRTGRYKYVTYQWGRYREQLFDLERDPGEMVNLAVDARHAETLNHHRELLAAWVEQTDDATYRNFLVPG